MTGFAAKRRLFSGEKAQIAGSGGAMDVIALSSLPVKVGINVRSRQGQVLWDERLTYDIVRKMVKVLRR